MAFDTGGLVNIAQLALIAGAAANRPNLWAYSTPDTHATVLGAGYFNGASRMMRAGDIIMATVVMGGSSEVRVYHVRSVSAAGVVLIFQQIFTA